MTARTVVMTRAAAAGRILAAVLLSTGLTCGAALAQTRPAAPFAVQGTVVDWKGSAVVGATVRLENPDRTYQVKTGSDGVFRFPAVVPGKYHGRVEADGFPPFDADVDFSAPPAAPLRVQLQVLVSERIDVRPLEEGNRNLSSMTLTGKALEALGGGDLYQRLRELAGATGKPGAVQIHVDGFRAGLRLPPREAIEMIRINANSFAAEFADLTDGRIEITTKPGVDASHGNLQFTFNDASLNARDAFAPRKPMVQMRNYEGYLGGPIVPKRLGFLAYAGRWEQDLSQVINATVIDSPTLTVAPFNINFETPARSSNLFVQTSYLAAKAHSLAASYSRTNDHAQNQGLESGRGLPEYGFERRQADHTARLALISTLGTRTLNEVRVEWNRRQPRSQASTARPAVWVLDAFYAGGNPTAFLKRDSTDTIEAVNHLTRAHGNHTFKAGLEVSSRHIETFDRSGAGGTFIFGTDVERDSTGALVTDATGRAISIAPIEAYRRTVMGLPGYGPSQFSIVTGDPSVVLTQRELAIFAQDDWRPSPRLTLSYGVRGQAQTKIRGIGNVAPRLGMVWAPDWKTPSTFRGGVGLYYGRVDSSLTLEALRLDGQRQRQVVIPRPAFFAELPASFDGAAASISSIRVKARDIEEPRTITGSLSYERQLPGKTFGSVEFRWRRADRLVRSRRLSISLADRAPVLQYGSTGTSSRREIVAGVRTYVFGQPLFINYTLGVDRNDTDGPATLPADSSSLAGEFAWAATDQRHNLTISGSIALPVGISLSPFVTLGTGRPFNITTGRDNNGDTIFTDRPSLAPAGDPDAIRTATGLWLNPNPRPGDPIIPRNFGRGAGEVNIGLYAYRSIKLTRTASPPATPAAPGAPEPPEPRVYTVSLSASAENLINRTNLTGYNGVLTSSAFGQAIRSMGPRRVQVSASFGF